MSKTLSIAIFLLAGSLSVRAQSTELQLIHSSADADIDVVDVWLDTIKIIEDFSFGTSSTFMELGNSGTLSISPSNSVDTTTAFLLISLNFTNGSRNIGVINGHISSGHSPQRPLEVHFYNQAVSQAQYPGYTDVLFYNGVTDLNKANISEVSTLNIDVAENLSYGSFGGYLGMEALSYRLQFADSVKQTIYREVELKLFQLGLADSAVTLIASGYINPSANSNGEALGLYLSSNQGGAWVPLPISTTRIQFINNSPDPALASVDFYLGNSLVANDIAFRTASNYLELPSGITQRVGAAFGSSSNLGDTLVSRPIQLDANKTYFYILNGLETATITPFKPLEISGFESQISATLGYNTDIVIINGATDAGSIDIEETAPLIQPLVTSLAFGETTAYLEVPSSDYRIQLESSSGDLLLRKYYAELSNTANMGTAQVWVVSGYADTVNNDISSQIGIWVAFPNGGPLMELSTITGLTDTKPEQINIYPNPVSQLLHLNGRNIESVKIIDVTGRAVFSTEKAFQTINVSHLPSGSYSVLIQSQNTTVVRPIVVVN